MTWQAKQVASGDYSQRVSYLGEFSDAFNTMTAQLKEREEQLIREAENLKRRSESVVVYNELLAKMMENRVEWIVVVDAETKEVVYCNQGTHHEVPQLGVSPCTSCIQQRAGREQLLSWSGTEQRSWIIHLEDGTSLRVMSYVLEWQERRSYVHVVSDVTALELEKRKLSNKAYFDTLTGIYNRAYFQEQIEKLLREHQSFTLGYLDMDGLKFVNDHFGHNEGDRYIRRFVTKILENFRNDDIFARVGGDEFCIILQGRLRELTGRKLEMVREKLLTADAPYPMSFSYGVFEVTGDETGVTTEQIMQQADQRMYQYKRKYKKQRTL
jgi:diguanylate cyclase (GGDEF)-like protein